VLHAALVPDGVTETLPTRRVDLLFRSAGGRRGWNQRNHYDVVIVRRPTVCPLDGACSVMAVAR
jgi:hypothetical protein